MFHPFSSTVSVEISRSELGSFIGDDALWEPKAPNGLVTNAVGDSGGSVVERSPGNRTAGGVVDSSDDELLIIGGGWHWADNVEGPLFEGNIKGNG